MFLKLRYRLGYGVVVREVSDSITWRRFCRIPLDGQVPHPTTLMKLTTTRTRLRDRSRSAGKRAHAIAAKLRLRSAAGRDEAQATVWRVTGELAGLAEHAARDAEPLLVNARRALARAAAKAADLAAVGVGGSALGPATPRGQRPGQADRRCSADHRADPSTGRQDHPGRGESAGELARPRRPPDRQEPPRLSRLSSTPRPRSGQRGRGRARSQRAAG